MGKRGRKRVGVPYALVIPEAEIPLLQAEFEQARADFAKGVPKLERIARDIGRNLVLIETEYSVEREGFGHVPYRLEQTYEYTRIEPLPKPRRWKCGAKTRSGKPCQALIALKPSGATTMRCRMHGGKSTGPRTPEGRAAIAESNRRRAQKKREQNNDS